MFVVDTNVLVYAADVNAAEHQRCRTLLERGGRDTRRGSSRGESATSFYAWSRIRAYSGAPGAGATPLTRICTRDTDFHRFGFIEPIDPLIAEP